MINQINPLEQASTENAGFRFPWCPQRPSLSGRHALI